MTRINAIGRPYEDRQRRMPVTMNGRFVSYLRVSTDRQGKSGLGLDAQRQSVAAYLNGGEWQLVAEVVEIETGKDNDRPQLAKALDRCRLTGATLVVAKIDRLARNARFLLSVVEGSGEGWVVFCDLPNLPPGPVGKFMLTQMAAVAELEAGLISQRTKAALSAAKARGRVLGGWRGGPKVDGRLGVVANQDNADAFANKLALILADMGERGLSLRLMAAELTTQGIQTSRGGQWSAAAVRSVLLRLEARNAPS
jgi:DNA invertase Pin-like site-specific DNA recombinase